MLSVLLRMKPKTIRNNKSETYALIRCLGEAGGLQCLRRLENCLLTADCLDHYYYLWYVRALCYSNCLIGSITQVYTWGNIQRRTENHVHAYVNVHREKLSCVFTHKSEIFNRFLFLLLLYWSSFKEERQQSLESF